MERTGLSNTRRTSQTSSDLPSAPEEEGKGYSAAGEPVNPLKRRRVVTACTNCRTRKSKCNGALPACSTCSELGYMCTYEGNILAGRSPLMVRNADFTTLQSRVQSLEQQLARVVQRIDSLESATPSTATESIPSQADRLCPKGFHTESLEPNGTSTSQCDVHPSRKYEGVDGMGIATAAQAPPSYYGRESAVNMTRLVMTALGASVPAFEQDNRHVTSEGHAHDQADMVPPASAIAFNPEEWLLPSSNETFRLLALFESDTWPKYPFLRLASLKSKTGDLLRMSPRERAGNPDVTRWFSLLNAVLALTTMFSGTSSEGPVFLRRAQLHAGLDLSRPISDSLEEVQSLLYCVLYLQSTHQASQCWLAIAAAQRKAIALGLHLSVWERDTDHDMQSPSAEYNELSLRTWYACVNLDRFVSMTLGRPCGTPCLEEPLRPVRPFPEENGEQFEYTTHVTNLLNILGLLQSQTSFRRLSCLAPGSAAARDLDGKLHAWELSLPQHLRIGPTDDARAASAGALMLALRYHAISMLLHRWSIQQSLVRGPFEVDEHGDVLLYESESKCIQSAMETVRILHQASSDGVIARAGAPWFQLYFIFNALILLIGSILGDRREFAALHLIACNQQPSASHSQRLQSCKYALKLIENLVHRSGSAAGCLQVAQQLLSAVEGSADPGNSRGHEESSSTFFNDFFTSQWPTDLPSEVLSALESVVRDDAHNFETFLSGLQ